MTWGIIGTCLAVIAMMIAVANGWIMNQHKEDSIAINAAQKAASQWISETKPWIERMESRVEKIESIVEEIRDDVKPSDILLELKDIRREFRGQHLTQNEIDQLNLRIQGIVEENSLLDPDDRSRLAQ